jgi:sugar/nucleoside kinase (ribokinase family)
VSETVRRSDPYDVVALGALNIDLIAVQGAGADAEDTEVPTTSDEILRRIEDLSLPVEAFVGGSAFNALLMLAQLQRPRQRLAMLGVAARDGRQHGLRRSHVERLGDLHVDTPVALSDRPPGLCSSVPGPNGRKLRPAPEANLDVASYLRTDRPRGVARRARILHLTSLLEDPERPGSTEVLDAVSEFVLEAKQMNPSMFLSFDPGQQWVQNLNRSALAALYDVADLLLVNLQEFEALTGSDLESAPAHRSLRHLCPRSTVVVVKGVDEVVLQHAAGFHLARIPQKQVVRPVDPTGAGDAVAAGILAALAESKSLVDGCTLGLRMAAVRVSHYGDRAHADLLSALGHTWEPSRLRSATLPALDDRSISVIVNNQNSQVNATQVDWHALQIELEDLIHAVDAEAAIAAELEAARIAASNEDEPRLRGALARAIRTGGDVLNRAAAPLVVELLKRWGLVGPQ